MLSVGYGLRGLVVYIIKNRFGNVIVDILIIVFFIEILCLY